MQAVEGARARGAAQIIGIDINKGKCEKREAFGMTHYINPKAIGDKSISEMVKELTNGLGVDYSFECTRVSHLVNEALESTKVVNNCPITQPCSIVFETATNSKLPFP